MLTAALTTPAHAFTWTAAPVNSAAGGNAFGMWMLTDGRVLSHGSALNRWVVLTPDKTGDYSKGTWSNVAASVHARGGAQQHMLKDGRFFQAGGEFIDGPACTTALCPTTEIYDPVANTWTATATAPMDIGDTGSTTLADGRILDSTRFGSGIQIYDPTTNTWSMGPSMPLNTGDENAWATLQNGNVLAVGFAGAGAAIYNPTTNTWKRTGPVPAGFNTGDTGGITQMFDGRVFVYGLQKNSYIYTPGATAADPGTWVKGPTMLDNEAEDEFSDILPNGMVMGALVNVMFGPGTVLQQFNPNTNTVSSFTPPPDSGNPFPIGYVNLPNGTVMVTAAARNWILTPDGAPDDSWRPVVQSVVFNAAQNNYTLTGIADQRPGQRLRRGRRHGQPDELPDHLAQGHGGQRLVLPLVQLQQHGAEQGQHGRDGAVRDARGPGAGHVQPVRVGGRRAVEDCVSPSPSARATPSTPASPVAAARPARAARRAEPAAWRAEPAAARAPVAATAAPTGAPTPRRPARVARPAPAA